MKNLEKAKAKLVLDQPFFATLFLKMRMVEDGAVKTACTDGTVIKYNPAFFEALTVDELVFVLAHEVMHVANLHHLRIGGRNLEKFNVAGDFAINGLLRDAGFSVMPGAVCDSRFDNMSAEQIYNLLPDSPQGGSGQGQGQKQQQGQGPGPKQEQFIGDFEPAKDATGKTLSEAEKKQAESEVAVSVKQAAQAAKMQGKLPASLARLVDEIVNPVMDWREVLRSFMDRSAKNDYSWTSPNRRHIAKGLYLPSLRSEHLRPLVVAVDTSGSIRQSELNQFQAELNDILQSYPCTVNVVYCDRKIHQTEVFTSDQYPVTLSAEGGGGTSLTPPFEWAEKNLSDIACLIYFTDLRGKTPDYPPNFETLWCCTEKRSRLTDYYMPKFGVVAFMNGN